MSDQPRKNTLNNNAVKRKRDIINCSRTETQTHCREVSQEGGKQTELRVHTESLDIRIEIVCTTNVRPQGGVRTAMFCGSTTTAAKLSRTDVLLLHLLDLFRLGLQSQLTCPLVQRLLVLLAVTVEAAHHLVLELPFEVVPDQASMSSEEGPRFLFLVLGALYLLCSRLPPLSTLLQRGWLHICELLAYLDSVFASGLDVEVQHLVDQRLRVDVSRDRPRSCATRPWS